MTGQFRPRLAYILIQNLCQQEFDSMMVYMKMAQLWSQNGLLKQKLTT
jgi:hypothetical protein